MEILNIVNEASQANTIILVYRPGTACQGAYIFARQCVPCMITKTGEVTLLKGTGASVSSDDP